MTTLFTLGNHVVESTARIGDDGRVTVVKEMSRSSKVEIVAPGDVYASVEEWVAYKNSLTGGVNYHAVTYLPPNKEMESAIKWDPIKQKYKEIQRGREFAFEKSKPPVKRRLWASVSDWITDVMNP